VFHQQQGNQTKRLTCQGSAGVDPSGTCLELESENLVEGYTVSRNKCEGLHLIEQYSLAPQFVLARCDAGMRTGIDHPVVVERCTYVPRDVRQMMQT
jgi:hypothetical protein